MLIDAPRPDSARTLRTTGLDWLAAATGVLLFGWVALSVFPNLEQDAWIYFTYFKRFFERPFSFQPGHVTFGATSPLHVVVMSPVFHLFGAWWLGAAKVLNFCLVLGGIALVHSASRAHVRLFPLLVAACACFETLMQATATLFESGVAFFLMSLLAYCFERQRLRATIVVAGLLPLARPELILVTMLTAAVLATRHRRLFVQEWAIALVPLAAYEGYMWASGAGIVPSSVVGRGILGLEFPATWREKIEAIRIVPYMRIYFLGLAVLAAALIVRPRRTFVAALVTLPLVALYTAVPPGWAYYTPRYLIPVIPGLLFGLAVLLDDGHRWVLTRARFGDSRSLPGILAAGVAAAAAFVVIRYAPHAPGFTGYTHDTILQKDLADAVSGVVHPGDRALMYEIQGQYYFPGHGISADGIVGREAHDFLLKRQTFDDFVSREHLKFIVTFNAFNYRPVYAGTPLVDIYSHDLTAAIGDHLCVGKYCYEKVVGNPHFNRWYAEFPASNVNVGTTMRYYSGDSDPRLKGQLIQWNSVYRVSPRPLGASATPSASAGAHP